MANGGAFQQLSEQLQPPKAQDHNNNNAFYSDLEDEDEIRLLYLQPKTSGDIINCTLQHVKLSEKPQYEALSYMWGPKDVQTEHTIIIDNSNFCVRENLWLALQHLRLEAEIRMLWIDAICINQQDKLERGHQVSQMGIVFRRASKVIVWLGAADDTSALAFRFLTVNETNAFIKQGVHGADSQERENNFGIIETMFLKNYWRRLWIVQEFLMAQDFVIQCGDNICTRFRLLYFLDAIKRVHEAGRGTEVVERIHQSITARL
ncbi:heterokaryon incompatibility protein-domain-containing protein, partial [Hyaloscypha finlandica]